MNTRTTVNSAGRELGWIIITTCTSLVCFELVFHAGRRQHTHPLEAISMGLLATALIAILQCWYHTPFFPHTLMAAAACAILWMTGAKNAVPNSALYGLCIGMLCFSMLRPRNDKPTRTDP